VIILVIVITTAWLPHSKASEVGKVLMEVIKKVPVDPSLSENLLDNVWAATKEGYKVVNASEVKEEKLKEYIAAVNKQLIMIAKAIEGYKYQIEIMSPFADAMAILGVELPE